MEEFLSFRLDDMIGRIHGPMNARIYIQTLVAIILAVRAGMRDAREENAPFFWALIAGGVTQRRDLVKTAWKDIGKVFVAALVLDIVYQIYRLHMLYPLEAIITATLLAVIPYVMVRAGVTRFLKWKATRS